jgi:hypothetical protein
MEATGLSKSQNLLDGIDSLLSPYFPSRFEVQGRGK